MAIQLAGNTVIHDNQNVQVSGVTTASSFVGDGSQLTNLPASGGTLEATASGTLADGSKVIVNTDGTVSVVAQSETTGSGVGDPTTFESSDSRFLSATYDSANGKVVIAYQDFANSQKGTAIVGTVSGTSISFGSPVVFESGATYHIRTAYDPINQKVVITYYDDGNSGYGTVIVGTVSGTSISFGSSTTYNDFTDSNSVIYDSTNQKIVIAFRDNAGSGTGQAIVGTISGTSISFGSAVTFTSTNATQISATFDSTNGKVVIAYAEQGNYYGTAVVGTVSGTSISFGTPVVFASASIRHISMAYDSSNQKIVIAFRDNASVSGKAIVSTVSGTSISFGAPVTFDSAPAYYISATYDSVNSKVLIAYLGTHSNYGRISVGTVSGTSISFTTMTFKDSQADYNSIIFDSSSGKAVIAFSDADNMQWYGKAIVFSTTGFPVAEIGSEVVFNTAFIQHNSSTFDSTNNKVVITYRDSGNSYYGTAVVGTVSGTSISFGSPVVFESATTQYTSTVYDSANDKVVIVYSDDGNSSRGTAVVGTVSGDSISFGSPVVFRSASCTYNSAAYDSANGKIVVAYSDGGNSDRGYTSVLTVSGTSVTYGDYRQFESGRVDSIGTAYDSANGKVVIAYQDGGNSYYGTAVVATISGTENTFGSPTVFEYSGTYDLSAAYDSSNQKVVITYKDQGNSWAGTAIVGTVSGTSISFGSPVVYASSPGSLTNNAIVYNSSEQKVVIAYEDSGNSAYGTAIVGTVSGTSISFGSPSVFNTATTGTPSPTYDSSNQKVVISYRDQGNSNYGTAITFSPRTISKNLTSENFIGISDASYTNGQTATIQISGSIDDAQSGLTPGQKYYVQNDGTLSETADNPSVFAGTAVASTKLIING